MRKKIKKAFTLVELLVVIAILAILATVSIVGYNSFTKKAKVSNDTALVSQLNTLLKADSMVNGDAKTPTDALKITSEAGYDVEKLTPTASDYDIIWNQAVNQFALLDENDNVVYGEKSTEEYKNWKFVSEYNTATDYSVYLKGTAFTGDLEVKAGIDVGNNTGISSITYTNTTNPQDVRIVTNGNTLVEINGYVDATNSNEGDVIEHYGTAGNVNVVSCAMKSYHEFGQIDGNITLKAGHVCLEKNSSVNSIILDTATIDTIAITQNEKATINGTVIALDETIKDNLKNSNNIKVNDDIIEKTKNTILIKNGISTTEFVNNVNTENLCVLTSNIELQGVIEFNNKKANIDLNNYELIITNNGACPIIFNNGSNANVRNGFLTVNVYSTYVGTMKIENGSKLELSNIKYNTNGSGVFPDSKSEIIIRDCKIKANGYGLGTNASKAQVNSPLINISVYNTSFITETSDFDNTALYINVPVAAYFENCNFNGGRQAVFVRGGTATFKDCTMSTSGKFPAINKYYNESWQSGNEVPVAALTIGNRSLNAYDYATNVTLLSTRLIVENNGDSVFALYAYGETKSNYTVSISYDSSCSLGRTNLSDEIGNVTVNKL